MGLRFKTTFLHGPGATIEQAISLHGGSHGRP